MNNQQRSISSALIMARVGVERGLSTVEFLAGSGLEPADLENPTRLVSFEQEFHLIRNLLKHCGGASGLGLEVGSRYRFTSLAALGFALVSSSTLRDAFSLIPYYSQLNASLVRVVVDAQATDLRIECEESDIPLDLRPFIVGRSFVAGLRIASDLLGRTAIPRAIEFSFAEPADVALYQQLTGVRPRFNAPKSALVFSQVDADILLALADPLALHIAHDQCRRGLQVGPQSGGLAGRVRELLAAQPAAMPAMGPLATTLCMSVRTLRRRLQEEGVTYLGLCDEVREAMAERLLTGSRLQIEQIAEALGYSESASFIHAFKRWTGESPHAFRQARAQSRSA
ncbi:AraC family transcriptional regulator [Pseudomonas gingeri]|uniref:AraC family transcriptional regulator n=1 Tax=Pseudomonas gingeri TaxID=117681 RepID=A0A7Y7WKW9_9PSED|nr:AraC family transcriptional regulator [Pseudomonas gingeri]